MQKLMGDQIGKARRSAMLVVTAAVAFLVPASPVMAAAPCETQTVHDYLKPLRGLPPLRDVPKNENLPFGPGGLSLSKEGFSSIVSWDEDFEFKLSSSRMGGTASSPINWLVTASLVKVNGHDRVREKLRTVARRLTRQPGRRGVRFRLPFEFEPGIYRYEIVFQDGAEKRLGRFGGYFRALSQRPHRELTLNDASFQPGQTVLATATEQGVGWISVADLYTIESYDGSTWSRASISPSQVSLLVGTLLGPGEKGTCWSFQIPFSASPGLYRFAVAGSALRHTEAGPFTQGIPLVLTSEFSIAH